MSAERAATSAVVFDLGGVLVDWDPRHLYRRLLPGNGAVEEFLAEIGFDEWNHAMDAGQGSWDEAVERLARRASWRRWPGRSRAPSRSSTSWPRRGCVWSR